MKKIHYIFYLFLIAHLTFSQSKNESGYFDTFISDTKIFFVDGASFFTYPFRMNKTQLVTTVGISAGIYILIRNDDKLQAAFSMKNGERLDNNFWTFFENYGVIGYAEIASIATYSVGYVSKNDDVRVLGRMMFQSLTYSGLSAMLIRMITGRHRPTYTDDHLDFIWFTTDDKYQSFPSGHTTVALAFSTVLAEYFDTPLSRIVFYGMAGISAAERIINNDHWFSDVTLGALLGIASGLHVINGEKKRGEKDNSRFSFQPTFNGFSFKYRLD